MIRNRDLFELWRVDYRTNAAQRKTALVWAHRMADALTVVEEYARREPHRFAAEILGISRLSKPDTDTEDYASVVWVEGTEPKWP